MPFGPIDEKSDAFALVLTDELGKLFETILRISAGRNCAFEGWPFGLKGLKVPA